MARILIIDDDVQMRSRLRQMLEREGYEVEEANNGKVALRAYKENPADLVITDIIMPEKEGLEIIRELRKDYPDVKVIAISGGGHISPDEYLYLAKAFGAQCVFAKPFERRELIEAVQELIYKNDKVLSYCID